MPRYTAWKTVIDGTEKKHRSEAATYKWLNEQAPEITDGTKVGVFVQESGGGEQYPIGDLSDFRLRSLFV
jgi:hypothetical protein